MDNYFFCLSTSSRRVKYPLFAPSRNALSAPFVLWPRTSPSHGENRGSSPLGSAIHLPHPARATHGAAPGRVTQHSPGRYTLQAAYSLRSRGVLMNFDSAMSSAHVGIRKGITDMSSNAAKIASARSGDPADLARPAGEHRDQPPRHRGLRQGNEDPRRHPGHVHRHRGLSDHPSSSSRARRSPSASSTKYNTAAPTTNSATTAHSEARVLPVMRPTRPIKPGPNTAANLPSML